MHAFCTKVERTHLKAVLPVFLIIAKSCRPTSSKSGISRKLDSTITWPPSLEVRVPARVSITPHTLSWTEENKGNRAQTNSYIPFLLGMELGTLLNRLFGTNFDVMNETARMQTTKGIWISKGRDMKVLIMDVEGTDGRERGEDQVSKHRELSFFMGNAQALCTNQLLGTP